MLKPTIIITAYSRPDSLKRILSSINNANYPDNDINLIISLDGGASHLVEDIAKDFVFLHGKKQVVERQNNVGLRNHIIWCGDQTEKYGSVIVLEDDLIVDPWFYVYSASALQFYKEEKKIAGISLYAQSYNEIVQLPFIPLKSEFDGYMMQIPSSWGQAWTKKQWDSFKNWYASANVETVMMVEGLPDVVKNWKESSWKKYYSAYLVEKELYFFYPYNSFTTNFADAGGTHVHQSTSIFQVELSLPKRKLIGFNFVHFIENEIFYDAYYEPQHPFLFNVLRVSIEDGEFDLYGSKPISFLKKKKIAITTKICKGEKPKFQLEQLPPEINLLYNNYSNGVGPQVYLVHSKNLSNNNTSFNNELYSFYNRVFQFNLKFVKFYVEKVFKKLKSYCTKMIFNV